ACGTEDHSGGCAGRRRRRPAGGGRFLRYEVPMTIFSIVLIILFFGLLIAVHELGHFIAAKTLGVRVNEFAIGMGPAIFSREKGETLYSLRAFPIGGFCAMEGEEESSNDPRSF